MRVIDLLNKIANGEHNFRFKYANDEYFWDFSTGNFIDVRCKENLGEKVCIDMILNDEIEIIEEKEEIKSTTKESIEALGYACGEIQKCFTNGWEKSLKNEPLIEENKKIEKVEQRTDTGLIGSQVVDKIEVANKINKQAGYLSEIVSKINEIIDKINEDK